MQDSQPNPIDLLKKLEEEEWRRKQKPIEVQPPLPKKKPKAKAKPKKQTAKKTKVSSPKSFVLKNNVVNFGQVLQPIKQIEVQQTQEQKEIEQLADQLFPKSPPVKGRPKKGRPKSNFRFNAATTFLTVPQYKGTSTKESIMERIIDFAASKKKQVLQIIVSLENHGPVKHKGKDQRGHENEEDPGVHFHVAFKVDKRWDFTSPDYFDSIFGQHVHMEPCRDFLACVVYTAKDGDFCSKGIDLESIKEGMKTKKGVKHIEVAKTIIENPEITPEELIDQYPGYLIQHLNKVTNFQTFVQTSKQETKEYFGIDFSIRPTSNEEKLIRDWLSENLNKKREHRQKQLYIYGPTKMGKTTLLMQLTELFKTYIVPDEANWWSNYNNSYQLAIFDEFCGIKPVSQMNLFLEGSKVPLNQKGVSSVIKKNNIPVIICSNKSPEEVYFNTAKDHPLLMEAFLDRLLVVNVTNPFSIKFRDSELLIENNPIVLLNQEEEEADDQITANLLATLEEEPELEKTYLHSDALKTQLFCEEDLNILDESTETNDKIIQKTTKDFFQDNDIYEESSSEITGGNEESDLLYSYEENNRRREKRRQKEQLESENLKKKK